MTTFRRCQMFLVINIVLILLIIRVSLNGKVLKAVMGYRWSFLLTVQHVFFFIAFTVIAFITGNFFLSFPQLLFYVFFVLFINGGIYYFVYQFLVPKYYLSKKYPEFILYALIVFLISSLFRILLEPAIFSVHFDVKLTQYNFLYFVYSLQSMVILMASFLGITKDKFLIERDYKELGEEKDQIHLDLMKSKLSPHFLLNTLNNIYVKSFDPKESTSASILHLSTLLQYVIYNAASDKIVLEREFATMKSLEQLYRMKYNKDLDITFNIHNEDTLELIEVPPAIFLTLFENALKHGAIGIEEDSFISISYNIVGQTLYFEIRNSISQREERVEMGYKGLGNEAIIHILKQYYDERFTFDSKIVEDDIYVVNLKIDL